MKLVFEVDNDKTFNDAVLHREGYTSRTSRVDGKARGEVAERSDLGEHSRDPKLDSANLEDVYLLITNPSSSIHYLSLQYFKRLLSKFQHIPFTFLLNSDNDLTVCLEAIDLLFPYIIFTGDEKIVAKLKNYAQKNQSLIFSNVEEATDFVYFSLSKTF